MLEEKAIEEPNPQQLVAAATLEALHGTANNK